MSGQRRYSDVPEEILRAIEKAVALEARARAACEQDHDPDPGLAAANEPERPMFRAKGFS